MHFHLPFRGLLLVMILLVMGANHPVLAAEFTGIVRAPEGVDRSNLRVAIHPEPPEAVENDPQVWATVPVNSNGEFSLSCTSPTLQTQIEITGQGVRRARFPWPFEAAGSPSRSPSFRLDPGSWTEATVVNADTNAPLSGALIGPVVPSEDIGVEEREKTYPFYARSGDKGIAPITGLLPDQSYDAQVVLEGYIRRTIRLDPGRPVTVTLKRGGLTLSGTLRGERTGRMYPHEIVLLTGGPETLHVRCRTDAEGRFSFRGLPEGTYSLIPVVKNLGGSPPSVYSIFGKQSLEGIWLLVPEGITIAGTVADVETGLPLAGAEVTVRDRITNADPSGRFEFLLVQGPWPVGPIARHPGYIFSRDEQDPELYPVNGYGMNDALGLVLSMRRERFLEVYRDNDPEPESLADLEMFGPLEKEDVALEREILREPRTVLPLPSAGTRAILLRTRGGFVSDLTLGITEMEATTTTIRLTPGPASRIEGSLTYDDGPALPTYRVLIESRLDGDPKRTFELVTTAPDENGQFTLDTLPPGPILVRLVRPEGEPYVQEEMTLVRGQTISLHRQVPRGCVLAGRTIDPQGNPLKLIPLSVYGQDPHGKPLHLNTVSDDHGRFRIEGWGGSVADELRASYHGYAPVVLKTIPLPNENLEILLSKRSGIEVTVNAPASSLATARVLVLVGRQLSVESASPQWFYESELQTPVAGENPLTIFPSSEGRLRIAAEADGEWDVSPPILWKADASPQSLQLIPGHTAGLMAAVEGLPEEEIDSLDVTLLNTALPELSAVVEFQPASWSADSLTFEDLPAGEYLLLASSVSGQYAAQSNIDIATGQQARLTLDFGASAFVIEGGIYADAEAQTPVVSARVALYFADVPDAEPLLKATTKKYGAFRFEGVPARRPYLVEARLDEQVRQVSIEADRAVGGAIQVDIVLEPETEVVFTVPDALRQRLATTPAIPILLQESSGSRLAMLRMPDLGSPMSLPPGSYRVSLGEAPLGVVEIPRARKRVEVALPDEPDVP